MLSLALAAALMAGQTDTPVTLASEPAPLHASMLRPEGEAIAAAVIIPGSGPTDRDGNNPLGVRNAALKQLAEGLATKGIASVRIDKRGIAASRDAGRAEEDLRFDDLVTDVRNWATYTARSLNKPCAWLIGHSEGALVAQVAASEANSDICGIVLVSGIGRPAGIVLREQLSALPNVMKTEAFHALMELEQGRTVANPPPALAALLRPSVQPYLISFLKHDPAKLAAQYTGPMFIGQGTADLQTAVEDAQTLSAARPQAELKLWDNVNHVLVETADRPANIASYANPEAKIDEAVVEDIASFIRSNSVQ